MEIGNSDDQNQNNIQLNQPANNQSIIPVTPPPTDTSPTPITPPAYNPTPDQVPVTNKSDFPFKPIEPDNLSKNEPQISAELDKAPVSEPKIEPKKEEDLSEAKIEVNDYSNGPSNFQKTNSNPAPVQQFEHDSDAPKFKTSNTRPILTILSIVIAFIALGFAGGFFGFKYSPKIAGLFNATADTDTSTSVSPDATQPQSTSTTSGDISAWTVYSNSQYLFSIKFPDNWYSQGTSDLNAKTVSFTSYSPTQTANSGYKVEITSQSLNGQDLKTWINSNNTISGIKGDEPSTLTIDSQEAYQQTLTGTVKTFNTYIKRNSDVVVISYTAPEAKFDEGKILYNKMVNSIQLN